MKKVNYQTESGSEMIAIITDLQPIEKVNGFKISFRLYNNTYENGGFETTIWIENADIGLANMFCGMTHEYKAAAKMVGAKINSVKTNNKVSNKWMFDNVAI